MTKIYLSYAYVDNQNFIDNEKAWISAFKDDLENELSFLIGEILPITIFHNKQFESPNLLTIKYIRNSDIFIVIGTPAYFYSDFCQKELQLFLKRKEIQPNQRVFWIEQKPTEDWKLTNQFPERNFFSFFDKEKETAWSRRSSAKKYADQIQKVANEIKNVLENK